MNFNAKFEKFRFDACRKTQVWLPKFQKFKFEFYQKTWIHYNFFKIPIWCLSSSSWLTAKIPKNQIQYLPKNSSARLPTFQKFRLSKSLSLTAIVPKISIWRWWKCSSLADNIFSNWMMRFLDACGKARVHGQY